MRIGSAMAFQELREAFGCVVVQYRCDERRRALVDEV